MIKNFVGGLLMAATMLTPLASASAQSHGERGSRAEQSRGGNGPQGMDRQRSAPRADGQRYQGQRYDGDRRIAQPRQDQRRVENRSPDQRRDGDTRRVEQRRDNNAARVDPRRDNNVGRVDQRRDNTMGRVDQRRDNNIRRDDPRRDNNIRYDNRRNEPRYQNRGGYDRRDNDRGRDWNRGGNSNRYGDWNRGWRNDNRYNWRDYRSSNRNVYRMPRYVSPYRGYGYNRFSIGVSLGSLFYSNRYWINNPSYYRLPPAYGNYRWVRYYDDALLVDVRRGNVVDVMYDFFW